MMKKGLFESVDGYFLDKKPSDLMLSILTICFILFFLSYKFAYPIAKEKFQKSFSNATSISAKLQQAKNQISQKTYTKNLHYHILKNQNALAKISHINSFIVANLQKISYPQKGENWASFLNTITTLASIHGVKITKISDFIKKPNGQTLDKVLDVHLDTNGDFHSMIKFINDMEKSSYLVDIYKFKLYASKDLQAHFDIAIYGFASNETAILKSTIDANKMPYKEYEKIFKSLSTKPQGVKIAHIDTLKNPFLQPKNPLANSTHKPTNSQLLLYAIMNKSANINGTWYNEGQHINSFQLTRIKNKSVILQHENTKVQLWLDKGDKSVLISTN